MNITIRDAAEEDFAAIQQLTRQVHSLHLTHRPDVFADVDPLGMEYFTLLLHDENTLFLVAESGGQVIGFCITVMRKPTANPLILPKVIASMDNLCVHADYRKHGAGKLLFTETLARAKRRGAEKLELQVWAFNEGAIRFYESLGMTVRSLVMETMI